MNSIPNSYKLLLKIFQKKKTEDERLTKKNKKRLQHIFYNEIIIF